jgi:hypothetical protein
MSFERFMLAAVVAMGIALFVWPFFGMLGVYGAVPFFPLAWSMIYLFRPHEPPDKPDA